MDLNTIRSILTVVAFAMFVGVVWWAYSARNKQAFAEAANLPFADDDTEGRHTDAGAAAAKGKQQ
jgi:cytochrome c oxidase cbb3-type subunit 4